MAVHKKYDRNVLGRGLDNIGNGKGKGLDALINSKDVETEGSSNLSEIAIDKIMSNPNQPRREFDQEALTELSNSIREIGIITPITLRQLGDGKYQIIAGDLSTNAAGKKVLSNVKWGTGVTKSGTELTKAELDEINRKGGNE